MEALLSLPKWKGGVKMHDFVKFNLSPDAQNNVAAFPDEVTAYSEIFQVLSLTPTAASYVKSAV